MNQKFISRISFLSKIILLWFLGLICWSCTQQSNKDIPFMTRPDNDQANNIRNYLMTEAERLSGNALKDINSLNDLDKIKDQRYNEFIETLGLIDVPLEGERPGLNVKITGTIKMDGYRIEKLYYESLPSLYVPANLYIPENNQKPCPAVVYLCGHAASQKAYYQQYGHKFARLGFVCLIVETVHQGEVSGEHHGCYGRGWYNWYSRGYTPAGVEVWNAIRGIDLLCSRGEVDPDNIGITGGSGGGAQSWFVAAVDRRVKAAAPASGATTLNEQILTRTIDGHCDCMMPINTYRRDFQDIGALIAPRALLIVQGDHDRLNTIEGVHEIYDGIKKIYKYYDVPENFDLLETYGGHGVRAEPRQLLFSFFLKQLSEEKLTMEVIRNIDESTEASLSVEDLKAYVDGPPIDDRTKTIQDSFLRLYRTPEISDEKQLFYFRDSVLAYLKKKTFGAFPEAKSPLDPHMIFRSIDRDKFGNNVFSFVTEEGWRLKLDIRWRNNPEEKKPLMIVLRNTGEGYKDSESFIQRRADSSNIGYFDVRGIQDAGWEPGLQWHIRRASAWLGRTIASMQVYDLLRCLEFCRTLEGIDPDKISIAASEGMGVIALYAALLDGNCFSLLLNNPPASQDMASRPDGKGEAIEMLNCLRVTDVCQIPALIPSTRLTFMGEVPDSYQWANNVRIRLGKEEIIKK